MTRAMTVVLAVGFLAWAPYPMQAGVPSSYTVQTIGAANSGTQALDINNSGQVTGSSGDRGFIWQQGVLTQLPTLPNAYQAYGYRINGLGQVAGVCDATSQSSTGHAVLWSGGTITDIGQTRSEAFGINDKGVVVGVDYDAGMLAASWDHGVKTYLSTSSGSFAEAINNKGQVCGKAGGRIVIWKDGVTTDLGLGSGAGKDINDLGQVCGVYAPTQPNVWHGYLWDPVKGCTDICYGGNVTETWGLNNLGQVVGYYYPLGDFYNDKPFLWDNGTFYDLNALIPAGSGVTLYRVFGINDLGQIVGDTRDERGFVLTPVPEPATLALLALGGALALLRRRSASA